MNVCAGSENPHPSTQRAIACALAYRPAGYLIMVSRPSHVVRTPASVGCIAQVTKSRKLLPAWCNAQSSQGLEICLPIVQTEMNEAVSRGGDVDFT